MHDQVSTPRESHIVTLMLPMMRELKVKFMPMCTAGRSEVTLMLPMMRELKAGFNISADLDVSAGYTNAPHDEGTERK